MVSTTGVIFAASLQVFVSWAAWFELRGCHNINSLRRISSVVWLQRSFVRQWFPSSHPKTTCFASYDLLKVRCNPPSLALNTTTGFDETVTWSVIRSREVWNVFCHFWQAAPARTLWRFIVAKLPRTGKNIFISLLVVMQSKPTRKYLPRSLCADSARLANIQLTSVSPRFLMYVFRNHLSSSECRCGFW